jgi:hypothetical protein
MDIQDVEIGRALSLAPPFDAPPSAQARYEDRAEWSARFVTWVLSETPQEGTTPIDVRATHLYEIEFNSCVADPEAYAREIEDELRPQRVH